MSKVRVPLHGKPQGFATLDTDATKGATVGVNLFWQDGSVVTEADFGGGTSDAGVVSRTLWSLVLEIPANVQAVAGLATAGFVRRDGAGAWTASPLVNADLSGCSTSGLAEGSNLYYTDTRADARVAAGIAAHVAASDPHTQYTTTAEAQAIADAKVADTIADGVTTKAPSQNAVFDALALKYDKTGGTISGPATVTGDFTAGTTAGGTVFTVLRPGTTPAGSSLQLTSPASVVGFVGRTGTTSRIDVRLGVNVLQFCVAASDSTPSVQAEVTTTAVRPGGDNSYNFGEAGRRWKEIFCANSTINTSDAREKTPLRPLTDAEIAVARELSGTAGMFQWLASVEEKGGDARLHAGVIAQDVVAVFAAHGLDASGYGFFCYDEWPESVEPAEYDEAGNEVRPAIVHPAGNRYGIRYGELAMFLIAGQEQRLRALEAKA